MIGKLGNLTKSPTKELSTDDVHAVEKSSALSRGYGWARSFVFENFQLLVHIGALLPLANLLWDAWTDGLTINPIQAATLRTGKIALVMLTITLACTPLNTLFGFRPALKARRALGLYTFMYAAIHFYIFIGVDYAFDLELLKEAIFEKRYALVGFAAFLILLPLAVTSFKVWQKKLGKNWKRLHRLVYLAGLLVIVHYVWQVKSDIRVPLAYGALIGALLFLRIPPVKKVAASLRQRLQHIVRTRSLTS
jgi:sulfoxide reductase heme-binding subunit YedZ